MSNQNLNPEQRRAAQTLEGPLLILAGAGSGKTKTLTCRVANLLEQGVPPWSILAITFTNKAAAEMRERIRQMTGDASEEVWISTFHAACAKILRRDIEKLGYTRSFTIYDDDDQTNVLKECLKQQNLDEKVLPPRTIRSVISDAKNHLLGPEDWFAQSDRDFQAQRLFDLYTAYETKLKAANALDFDDLLMKTLELFVVCPPVLEAYQRKFLYIHVDEYQDTNYAQYMLIRMLSEKHRNLCVVGDDDQSIYGWRGADISNILDFEKDYPEATVIKLEQNYRSTSNILDAANQVIARNEERKDKALWTEKGEGAKIGFCRLGDEREEAAWVIEKIRERVASGRQPSDFAILYRTNAQSRILEEQLVRSSMKYRIYGGLRFYERKEIKDILAYLRLLVNPSDDVSVRRIINVPRRSIGETTVAEMMRYAQEQQMPLLSACMDLPESLSARQRSSVTKFATLMMELAISASSLPVGELVQQVIDRTGLCEPYRDGSDEGQQRLENVSELMGAVHEYEEKNESPSLVDFLENVALVSDLDALDEQGGALTLMTLHSAKGLEFPCVFVVGMEENLFPSARCQDDPKRLEEERRLCYVGITRAEEELFLTCATRRMLYNQLQFNEPSRFLADIPERVLQNLNPRRESHPSLAQPAWSTPVFERQVAQSSTIWRKGEKPLTTKDLLKGAMGGPSAASPAPAQARRVRSIAAQERRGEVFAAGERVVHKKFGSGVVLRISQEQGDTRAMVRFDDTRYGVRQLSLALAPLVHEEG